MLDGARFAIAVAWRTSKGALAAVALALMLFALVPATQVILIKILVDRIASGAALGELFAPLLGVALVAGLAMPINVTYNVVLEHVIFRSKVEIRVLLTQAAAAATPRQHEQPTFRDELVYLQRAVAGVPGNLIGAVLQTLAGLIMLASVAAVLVTISPWAAVWMLLASVPFLLAGRVVTRLAQRSNRDRAPLERQTEYAERLLRDPDTAMDLASLGAGRRVVQWMRAAGDGVLDHQGRETRRRSWLEIGSGLCSAAFVAIALYVVVVGTASAGAAAAIVGALAVADCVGSSAFQLGNWQIGGPQMAQVDRFVAEHQLSEPVPVAEAVATVRVEGLSFCYPAAVDDAVTGVGLQLRSGQLLAVVGPNGAGKTTLVKLLLGLYSPRTGTISIDDQDAAHLSEAERLAYFGVLYQEFGRYQISAAEAVTLGRPAEQIDHDRLWSALRQARCADFVQALPAGVDTPLGREFASSVGLSGGQWQRLALARIYYRDAPIWILDEPTSAVDAEAEQQVFEQLRGELGDRIGIVVSHRLSTVKAADEILVLDGGRVVERGTYQDLVAAEGRFAELFRHQMS